jgi:hypothetical protein
MLSKLYPKIYVNTIQDIDWEKLHSEGICGLIFDLDNTLVEWDNDYVEEELQNWLQARKGEGFKICLVSNNKKQRVEYFGEQLGIPAISHATKPRKRAFRIAMNLMGTHRNNTAVIGDQVFTDILGGNRLNLFTILVVPKSETEFFTTKLVRFFESLIISRLKRKGRIKEWD